MKTRQLSLDRLQLVHGTRKTSSRSVRSRGWFLVDQHGDEVLLSFAEDFMTIASLLFNTLFHLSIFGETFFFLSCSLIIIVQHLSSFLFLSLTACIAGTSSLPPPCQWDADESALQMFLTMAVQTFRCLDSRWLGPTLLCKDPCRAVLTRRPESKIL